MRSKMHREERHKKKIYREDGYTILAVLILTAVGVIAMSTSLELVATGLKTGDAYKKRSDRYFETEATVAKTLSWMRKNSQQLTNVFRPDELYTHFDVSQTPTVGSNDNSGLGIMSHIKSLNGSNTIMLSTDGGMGTSYFQGAEDLTTNSAWDAVAQFAALDLGEAEARITVENIVPLDPTKDYGPPPAAEPETEFNVVYRIDAMSDTSAGIHLKARVLAEPVPLFKYGMYGEDYLELRQPCDSYDSELGAYSNATKTAKCGAGSNSTSQIHKNEILYGFLDTNGEVVEGNPYGGLICEDFQSGCPNEGRKCAGEDCGVPLLEQFDTWSQYCAAQITAGTVPSTLTVGVGDTEIINAASGANCWNRINIRRNGTLILPTTNIEYYVNIIDFQHGTAKLEAQPATTADFVELYVQEFDGDRFNGNQVINTNARPYSLRVYYLGTNAFTLNGSADMYLAFVAPNANISVGGSFDMYGAVMGKRLSVSGSGTIHYDQSLSRTSKINNYKYTLIGVEPVYQ